MIRRRTFRATLGLVALSFMFAGVTGTASASQASIRGIIAQTGPPATRSFGVPPSGEIPILYNDHHVYAKPTVLTNGRVLGPINRGGTLFIPLRSMFEQLGATVAYDSITKTVTVVKPGAEVKVTIGVQHVIINGESYPLDVPPIIDQGILLVPIRVIAETMGAYVEWVPDRHIVVVRYVPPPLPSAPPPPPPPPPTLPPPGPIQESTFGVYDSSHPEYGLLPHQVFYGRYSYVLLFLDGDSFLNTAVLEALVHRYVAPGRQIVPGIPMNTDNPHEFNLFELPVLSSAWHGPNVARTDTARAASLKSVYNWNAAVSIRDSYCNVPQHANFRGICAQPRDKGPIIVTFFAPIPRLSRLRPAFAYDFSNVPSDRTIIDSVLDVIQKQISIPQGVSADESLPPSEQLKVAQFLEAANAALVSGGSHVLAFAEKLDTLKKLLSP